MNDLEEIILDQDELEALRCADLLKHSHEEAAAKMAVSRATFGRIISSARMKIADGVLNGKAIRINEESEASTIIASNGRCKHCGHSWKSRMGQH
jgi:predicted DNA-binding protein (UPF0251 family)